VAALMGGRLAPNPVQAYWDIELPDGAKVQVKYLVNSADPSSKAWVNEHLVRSLPDVDWYTLVIIEGFKVSGVAAFPPGLGPICRALGKQHGDLDTHAAVRHRSGDHRDVRGGTLDRALYLGRSQGREPDLHSSPTRELRPLSRRPHPYQLNSATA
jgi:hypothetical protein